MGYRVLREPVPIGEPYERRGKRYQLHRVWREKWTPVMHPVSGAFNGWMRRIEWYVKDLLVP